jgi:hypothetical protein
MCPGRHQARTGPTTQARAGARPIAAVLIISALAASASIPALADEAPRYAVKAELQPLSVSTDGRFGLAASARYVPEQTSADGRFTLKAVNAPQGGCDPFPDPVFADGFEAP